MAPGTKRVTRRLIREMCVILAAAGALGVAMNLSHPRGFVLVSRTDIEARKNVPISAAEAGIKRDAGAVFVDAREKAEFKNARVPGAINIPALDAEAKTPGMDFGFLDRPAEIVIYCDGPSCGASALLAEAIRKRGYGRVLYMLEEGLSGWEAKGYPVERGARNGK